MPDPEPDADTLARLAAWEEGQGAFDDPASHPDIARMRADFDALPETRALQTIIDAAQNDPAAPLPVTVDVQPGLLALLTHIEGLDSKRAGRAPLSQERLLSGLISNHLENLLHALVTDPTRHPHYAKAWNALCAQAGAGELSVPDGMPSAGPESDEEGVF